MKATIIYTTDGKLNPQIRDFCFEHLKANAPKGIPIIKVENSEGESRSYNALFENILAGLEKAETNFIFLAEHDVLYPAGYFEVNDNPKISYSKDVLYLSDKGFYKRNLPHGPLSTFAGDKEILKEAIAAKINKGKIKSAEPGIDDEFADLVSFREVKQCVIDIRHGENFTGERPAKRYNKTAKGWGYAAELWEKIVGEGNGYKSFKKEMEETNDAIKAKALETVTNKKPKKNGPAPLCVSVVIVTRCEPLLAWTIENVKRTAPGCEILVVYDGWQQAQDYGPDVKALFPWPIPLGVGPCRDYGISQASGEFVVLLDAHMDFEPGWLEKLLAPVQENREAITCSKSAVLRPEMLDMAQAEKINTAARMEFLNVKGMPFEPKWVKPNTGPGEVQIVLGACYGMARAHYMETLFRPWRNAFGWGSSEQLISVVNWFLGGKNIITDALSGHVYRRRDDVVPYPQTNATKTGMFYNRCRVIDLLPISDDRKKGLIDAVLNRKDARAYHKEVRNLFLNRDDDLLKEAIEIRGLSWDDYEKRWYPSGVKFPSYVERKEIKKHSTYKPVQTPAELGHKDDFGKPAEDSRFI